MDTYAADDYVSIAARLREIEKRHDSSAASWSPSKWGIWNLHAERWVRVDGTHHGCSTRVDGFWPPTPYYTEFEAELEIAEHMSRHPDYRAEAREYPGE